MSSYILGYSTPGGFEEDHRTLDKVEAEAWVMLPINSENVMRVFHTLMSTYKPKIRKIRNGFRMGQWCVETAIDPLYTDYKLFATWPDAVEYALLWIYHARRAGVP